MFNLKTKINFFLYLFSDAMNSISSSRVGFFSKFFLYQRFFFVNRFASFFSLPFINQYLFFSNVKQFALKFSNLKYVGPSLMLFSCTKKDLVFSKTVLSILALCSYLKFDHLIDLTATDFLGKHGFDEKSRFQLSYIFTSFVPKLSVPKLQLNFMCSDICKVYTISDLFPSAGWAEREIWDFFGIRFEKHLDLRRILSDYGFRGFPLRKDFPTVGFKQVKYDAVQDSVIYESLFLMQEERESTFVNPWALTVTNPLFKISKTLEAALWKYRFLSNRYTDIIFLYSNFMYNDK